jgi:hypothetical protein
MAFLFYFWGLGGNETAMQATALPYLKGMKNTLAKYLPVRTHYWQIFCNSSLQNSKTAV